MHLFDTSSIAQHIKKYSSPTTGILKILTENATILKHQNDKQNLQILEALHIRNLQPNLKELNFKQVLMSLATDTIYRTILKVNATHCNGPDALLTK